MIGVLIAGTRSARSRHAIVKEQYDGEVCPSLEEELTCGSGACNQDCILDDWSDWSDCSKACGGGHQRSTRDVKVEAKGTGECWEPQDDERVEYRSCNTRSCNDELADMSLAENTYRTTLKCNAMIDLTIVVDASSSLKQFGWDRSKKLVELLVESLTTNVRVALLKFSGPSTWDEA